MSDGGKTLFILFGRNEVDEGSSLLIFSGKSGLAGNTVSSFSQKIASLLITIFLVS
jgi:hypothetical protein